MRTTYSATSFVPPVLALMAACGPPAHGCCSLLSELFTRYGGTCLEHDAAMKKRKSFSSEPSRELKCILPHQYCYPCAFPLSRTVSSSRSTYSRAAERISRTGVASERQSCRQSERAKELVHWRLTLPQADVNGTRYSHFAELIRRTHVT